MATDTVVYARVQRVLDHPLERVWPLVGAFGGLEQWADGVTACDLDGEVRTVTRNGSTVRERLDRRDPEACEIAYTIMSPHPLPADDVRGTIVLRAVDADRTEIVWRSEARNFRAAPDALGARIEHFYAASIDGLDRLLSAG